MGADHSTRGRGTREEWVDPSCDFPTDIPFAVSKTTGIRRSDNKYGCDALIRDALRHAFQRIPDQTIRLRDGDETAIYPVVVHPRLDLELPEGFNAELAEAMTRLATIRNDTQQNGVVEDIVDPELFPQFIAREKVFPASPGHTVRSNLINNCVRGTYAWIPSLVAYDDATKEATFKSPIQNLPRTSSNVKLYGMLEQLLSKFMGSCVKTEGEYKVSVKLQRYVIPPGVKYTGKWHTEGVTEAVSAAAVYYAEWPEELEGGFLKFCPATGPEGKLTISLAVECGAGSAVAFRNTIPHRFETLCNPTDRPLVRSFVNFFLVERDLPTTREVPTNADLLMALVPRTNIHVAWQVMEYLNYTPLTYKEALQLRAVAKAEMVNNPDRWGNIHYGNWGAVDFIPSCTEKAANLPFHWDDDVRVEPDQGESGDNHGLNPEYLKKYAAEGVTVDDVFVGRSMNCEHCFTELISTDGSPTALSGN